MSAVVWLFEHSLALPFFGNLIASVQEKNDLPRAITTLHLFAWLPPQHDVGIEGRFLGWSKTVVWSQ